jgi:hypothetical protein
MNSFLKDLDLANELIKKLLRDNKDLAEHPFHQRDERLLSVLSLLRATHPEEFNKWVKQKNLIKIEEGIRLNLAKSRHHFKSDNNGIHLKHGVLSLGSYPYKNVHLLLQEFDHLESDQGYYVLAVFLTENPRLELFNVDSILSKINKSERH